MKNTIIHHAEIQESVIISSRDYLLSRNKNPKEDKTYLYERAKLIGIMDIMDCLKIDRTKFNWIFL